MVVQDGRVAADGAPCEVMTRERPESIYYAPLNVLLDVQLGNGSETTVRVPL